METLVGDKKVTIICLFADTQSALPFTPSDVDTYTNRDTNTNTDKNLKINTDTNKNTDANADTHAYKNNDINTDTTRDKIQMQR